ncbi:MAG: DUF1801 domain-containing protein [Fimbriimonadaceae bacterium]|nr:DUF1801 domain-containing protein [Fimbriimonadaceae bacterium]
MSLSPDVEAFLAGIPEDRAECVRRIVTAVAESVDPALITFTDRIGLHWGIPLEMHPAGYHCTPGTPVPFVSVANQKSHIGLYLFCTYTLPGAGDGFVAAAEAEVGKVDMGKSCLRIKKCAKFPEAAVRAHLKSISAREFLDHYIASIPPSARKKG